VVLATRLVRTGEDPVSTIPKPLDELYEAHHAMVYRTAHRITGNAPDAEDVMQTVFMRMLKRDQPSENKPGAAEIENPESYLRRAAVNAALDIVRARQADNTLELEHMATSGSCTELRDLRDTMRRALSKLSPKTAEMVALRFFEGYTNPEIAKLMGMSQIVVAVTVHRARKKLQQELIKGTTKGITSGKTGARGVTQ
jgi:RNA polymerase sigma-70 factor (ECF subfamily)